MIGRDKYRIGIDDERVIGIDRESMSEEREDGRQSNQPPRPAFAGDDQPEHGDAQDERERDHGPFKAAGEKNQFESMRILGPVGIDSISDNCGGNSGKEQNQERQDHGGYDNVLRQNFEIRLISRGAYADHPRFYSMIFPHSGQR